MSRNPFFVVAAVAAVALTGVVSRASAQAGKPPTISGRSFKTGSAKLTVTGTFQIDADVAINDKASFGDGEKTWIQFGVSGSAEPNVLITYGDDGFGIIVGRGKRIATAEPEHCKGETKVTASEVSAHYKCTGVESYDASTGKMGKIEIEVTFTAKS